MKVYEIMSRVVVGRGETIHCIRLNPDGGKVEESRISGEALHNGGFLPAWMYVADIGILEIGKNGVTVYYVMERKNLDSGARDFG